MAMDFNDSLNAVSLDVFVRTVQDKFHILLPDKKGDGYICPHCGNGSGDDGTGIHFNQLGDGHFHTHCFKCGYSGDFAAILADFCYHLDCKSQFNQVLQRAASDFGFTSDYTPRFDRAPAAFWKIDEPDKKRKAFIDFARNNLSQFLNSLPNKTFRGLTFDTLKTFGCGYSAHSDREPYPRLIIPTSYNHWLSRALVSQAEVPDFVKDFQPKKHSHKKEIFGLPLIKNDKPIFAVEGELDAMSIHQLGFNAIAFSGTSVTQLMLQQLSTLNENACVILMLDNDDAGKIASSKLTDKLKKVKRFDGKPSNLCVFQAFLDIQGCKDANDALQADPIILQKRLQEIYDKAITHWDKHIEVAEKLHAVSEQQATSKQLISSCPVDVAIPDGYSFSEQGIFKLNKRNELEEIVGNPVVISRKIISHDNLNGALELVIYNRREKKWFAHFFPEEHLADPSKITKLSGMGLPVAIGRGKPLSEFLVSMLNHEKNIERIKEYKFYEQTGWTDDGNFIYPEQVHGDLANVRCDGFDYVSTFSSKGDKQLWLDTFHKIFTSSYAARTTLAAALAGPIVGIARCTNVQLHLNSPSGSGKSSAATFAMSIYGDPTLLHKTYNGTPNSIENLSVKFNDMCYWLDEWQSASKAIKENRNSIIYNRAEGVTKSRLNKNAEDRPTRKFRCSFISTGEEELTTASSDQGAKNRVIEINGARVLPNDFALQVRHIATDNYGLFGKLYVNFLAANRSQVADCFWSVLRHYSTKDIPDRLSQQWSAMHSGMNFFLQCIGVKGARLQEYRQLLINDFNEYVANSPSRAASTNAKRALALVAEEINSNPNSFIHENVQGSFTSNGYSENLGVIFLDGSLGLFPAKLNAFLKNQGFSATSPIVDAWSDDNLLDEPQILDRQGHKHMRKVKTSLERMHSYVYLLKKSAFSDYWDSDKEKLKQDLPDEWRTEPVE